VRYIIKNLGMALEIGDSQEEVNVRHEEQLRWSPDASMCSMWEFLSPPFYFNSYPWRSHRNPNPLKKLILQTDPRYFSLSLLFTVEFTKDWIEFYICS
jgi:hypothetical protein